MKIQRLLRKVVRRARRFPVISGVAPKRPKRIRYSAYQLEHLAKVGKPGPGLLALSGGEAQRAVVLEGRYILPEFVDHIDYEPPGDDVVFASVCNDKYEPGLEATVLSLKKVYPGLRCRYLVYHDETLSKFSQQRLARIYPHFEFHKKDPDFFEVSMGEHYNHQRVGRLGYLTLHSIRLAEPEFVVILDSDLLILDDISPLWNGDRIKAVPDIGHRPYGARTKKTGLPIINSGVLSLPRSVRGEEAWKRALTILSEVDRDDDSEIEGFADQRFWNIYLRDQKIELLPQNFNCIKTLVTKRYTDEKQNVSVLHMTGPKPWYSYLNETLLTKSDRSRFAQGKKDFKESFALWYNLHHRELLKSRLSQFREEMGPSLEAMSGTAVGRPAVMIGNGPSISRTDLGLFDGFEKFAFNWFINHDQFDEIKPDHLIIPSHMLFGGWSSPCPEFPEEYIQGLLARKHRPKLWFSFYFKDYIETLDSLKDYEKNYVFFEKPFKRRVADTGVPQFDIYSPLTDCNTGVLTVGVPLALHLGCRRIVLVGCDSNYASAAGSYFYRAESHASQTTRESTLTKTWMQGGEGQYGYDVTRRALEKRHIDFFDATLDGSLVGLKKISLGEVPTLVDQPVNHDLNHDTK